MSLPPAAPSGRARRALRLAYCAAPFAGAAAIFAATRHPAAALLAALAAALNVIAALVWALKQEDRR